MFSRLVGRPKPGMVKLSSTGFSVSICSGSTWAFSSIRSSGKVFCSLESIQWREVFFFLFFLLSSDGQCVGRHNNQSIRKYYLCATNNFVDIYHITQLVSILDWRVLTYLFIVKITRKLHWTCGLKWLLKEKIIDSKWTY